MLVGAIVHSMMVSEMINVLTRIDSIQIDFNRQKEVIDGFARHTGLHPQLHQKLRRFIEDTAASGNHTPYDRDAMRELLTNGFLPHKILNDLPSRVFGGMLQNNLLVRVCYTATREVPPRLVPLIA